MTSEDGTGRRPFGRTRAEDRDRASRYAVVASQRGRIIEGAVEAAYELGYAGTTLADIVSRARVSRTTFYEHFAGKNECLAEGVALAAAVLRKEMASTAASTEGDAAALVEAMIGTYCRVIAGDPDFATVFFCVALEAGEPARAAHTAGVDGMTEDLLGLLERAGLPAPGDDGRALVALAVHGIVEHTRRLIDEGGIGALPAAAAGYAALVDRVTG